jgi:hypothetical protein
MYIEHETGTEKTLACFVVDPLKPFAMHVLALMYLVIDLRHKSVKESLDRGSIAWAAARCGYIILAGSLK